MVFLACFLISVAFWFTTSMSRTYESIITIPVSYRNLPITKHIEGDLPPSIDFHFRGTGFELFGLYIRKQPDSIVVDLTASMGKNGQINLPSDSLSNQLKSELKPTKIVPEFITPDLASRSSKKVPVLLQSDISFRDRFMLNGRIVLRPDSMEIAGPPELLEKVHFVKTEKIKVSDIHSDYFGGVNLSLQLPKGVQLTKPYIHYFIPVTEYTEGVAEVAVAVPPGLQNKVTLLPSKVKITYQVELSKFNRVKPEDFLAYTDITLSRLPQNLEVKLKRTPPGVLHVRISPQYIDYLVKE